MWRIQAKAGPRERRWYHLGFPGAIFAGGGEGEGVRERGGEGVRGGEGEGEGVRGGEGVREGCAVVVRLRALASHRRRSLARTLAGFFASTPVSLHREGGLARDSPACLRAVGVGPNGCT